MNNDVKIKAIRKVASLIGGTVRNNYSGRGMFGETCYGIDCDDHYECVVQSAMKGLPKPTIDNMGKGYIVYWPKIKEV